MSPVLFENARVFDGFNADCPEGMQVLVEEGVIKEVSDKPIKAAHAQRIDVGGRTLMPGLIDAHVHAYFCDVNVHKVDLAGEPYRTAHAVRMLGFALDCGFTTVRDTGGGDYSLSQAINHGLIRAPRFLYAGKILSMTGGHGDMRHMNESRHTHGYCSCGDSHPHGHLLDRTGKRRRCAHLVRGNIGEAERVKTCKLHRPAKPPEKQDRENDRRGHRRR